MQVLELSRGMEAIMVVRTLGRDLFSALAGRSALAGSHQSWPRLRLWATRCEVESGRGPEGAGSKRTRERESNNKVWPCSLCDPLVRLSRRPLFAAAETSQGKEAGIRDPGARAAELAASLYFISHISPEFVARRLHLLSRLYFCWLRVGTCPYRPILPSSVADVSYPV